MADLDRDALITALSRLLAAGAIDPRYALPALRDLGQGQTAAPAADLIEALDAAGLQSSEPVRELAAHLKGLRRRDALAAHRASSGGQPLPEDLRARLSGLPLDVRAGWETPAALLAAARDGLVLLGDLAFAGRHREASPGMLAAVEERLRSTAGSRASLWRAVSPPDLAAEAERRLSASGARTPDGDPERAPDEAIAAAAIEALRSLGESSAVRSSGPSDEQALDALRARFASASSRAETLRLIDAACAWPTARAAALILDAAREPRERERADLILKMRFGGPAGLDWVHWQSWLQEEARQARDGFAELSALLRARPLEFLFLWAAAAGAGTDEIAQTLRAWCESHVAPSSPEDFLERWEATGPGTWSALEKGARRAAPPPLPSAPASAPQPPPVPAPAPVALPAAPIPPPPRRSVLWERHVQPFFAENWYMVAGVAMVLAGASLLAYYTWDKSRLLRYTVMPTLLAGFTAALAGAASWIERRDAAFRGTAAVLRGAAIGLLPVNFMTVALLSSDDEVRFKALAVPLAGAAYVGLAGWALSRWCAAVHPGLKRPLAGTLLFLNALVIVAPLARAAGAVDGESVRAILGSGFHAGFAVLAAAVVWLSRTLLTREMAGERRVPWFAGAVLALTFLQVFVWTHGSIGQLPRVWTYAPMVVLAGGLVFVVERCMLQLRGTPETHSGASFAGFGLIGLGALMGASQPFYRIAVLALAGLAWLYQAWFWRQRLHFWIGLTLLSLSAASIGLLDGFPGAWLPALGIAAALGLGGIAALAKRRRADDLAVAAGGVQVVALVITAVAAALAQWHFRSPPLIAGLHIVLVAAILGWRAHREERSRWIHGAMLVLALALPYLGFVDVERRTLQGNTMVFALAAASTLWLALIRATKQRALLLDARSTVLWLYGALAVAAMAMRVIIERGQPVDPEWYRDVLDYLGPLLMVGVLAVATYHSRSLVPAGMAVFIVAILFPELRNNFRATFDALGWGSGLGSAASALGVVAACFFLRRAAFLRDLGPGDLFLGKEPFPLQRRDHTLFTWPLAAAAVFLLVKVATWSVARNLIGGGPMLKTAAALIVGAAAWVLLSIYERRRPLAAAGGHLGWFTFAAGACLGYRELVETPDWEDLALVGAAAPQALFFLYRFGMRRWDWSRPLLAEPLVKVLAVLAPAAGAACLAGLFFEPWTELAPLAALAAAQLAGFGLSTRRYVHGALLYLAAWAALVSWHLGGEGLLRLPWDAALAGEALLPTLGLAIGVHAAAVVLESAPRRCETIKPLLAPCLFLASSICMLIGAAALPDMLLTRVETPMSLALLVAALALTARAHACAPAGLLALIAAYLLVHARLLREDLLDWPSRLVLLASPWRASLLALVAVAAVDAARRLAAAPAGLLEGPLAQRFFRARSAAWVYGPACALAVLAAVCHTAVLGYRVVPMQLLAPYLGTLALALAAWSWRRPRLVYVAAAVLTLGNVQAARWAFDPLLIERGLSTLHLVAFGITLTVAAAWLLRTVARGGEVQELLSRVGAIAAGLVFALLAANYAGDPNLSQILPTRFAASGAMALIAGLHFRSTARRLEGAGSVSARWHYGLYHFGVVLAVWCAALLEPRLRDPTAALWALGAPVPFFWFRAEALAARDRAASERFRTSAAILGFVLLALYASRSIFQMVLFPGEVIDTGHYHHNSLFIIALAAVLFRLHGLGGTSWLAFYGGLALMAGSYFALTWVPRLSPFERPIAGAWCALALGHLWTLASGRRSPLRAAIQSVTAMDESAWRGLRRSWGLCLLAAAHIALLWGLADAVAADARQAAPLVLGAAGLTLYHGALRRSRALIVFAALEALAALHADFIVESFLHRDAVVWALLGIWAAVLAVDGLRPRAIAPGALALSAAALAAGVFAHVLYHRPWSAVGLWTIALGAALAAATPRPRRMPQSGGEQLACVLIVLAPTWLAYFSQAPIEERGLEGALDAWPLLAAIAAAFATGWAARAFQDRAWPALAAIERPRPRLLDQTLAWLGASGGTLQSLTLWGCFLAAAAVQAAHYGRPFDGVSLTVLLLLQAAFAVSWHVEGRRRQSMAPYVLLQLSVLAFFALVRRQLQLTTDLWTHEYDVWVSLAVSAGLAGAKRFIDRGPRSARVPLLSALFVLPALAMAWVLIHGLGSNIALVVVGLHSVIFAFLGKDDRDSPYALLSVAGFVAFVLVLFWAKLELRVVHAYVIPVGLGVLVLLQLLRDTIDVRARNAARAVALLSMLGSSAWYALLDDRFPLAFLLTLGALCLFAMAIGGFLRVRLYLFLGFAGLLVDLAAVLYRVLVVLPRGPRMTLVGSIVLAAGAALVFGAIFYKTHKAAIDERIARWRERLGAWE